MTIHCKQYELDRCVVIFPIVVLRCQKYLNIRIRIDRPIFDLGWYNYHKAYCKNPTMLVV